MKITKKKEAKKCYWRTRLFLWEGNMYFLQGRFLFPSLCLISHTVRFPQLYLSKVLCPISYDILDKNCKISDCYMLGVFGKQLNYLPLTQS